MFTGKPLEILNFGPQLIHLPSTEAIADLDEAVNIAPADEEDRIVEKDLLALQKKYASYR